MALHVLMTDLNDYTYHLANVKRKRGLCTKNCITTSDSSQNLALWRQIQFEINFLAVKWLITRQTATRISPIGRACQLLAAKKS